MDEDWEHPRSGDHSHKEVDLGDSNCLQEEEQQQETFELLEEVGRWGKGSCIGRGLSNVDIVTTATIAATTVATTTVVSATTVAATMATIVTMTICCVSAHCLLLHTLTNSKES